MKPIFKAYIREYIETGLADRADPTLVQDSYEILVAVSRRWEHQK